jgi:hydroxymethylbilane synthase
MKTILRIATRNSPLALWQANYVKDQLQEIHPILVLELVPLMTQADKQPQAKLADIGGKGIFIKELEKALLEDRADIAVHSIKDMTVELMEGLVLSTVCKREDPRDVFLSPDYQTVFDLPNEAIVGTSSLRRQCQLKALRPDLQVKHLRGNIGTRLDKVAAGEFSAIILAAAGLKRLQKTAYIRSYLETDVWLPAVGQGAIGIECRADDKRSMELLAGIDHPETHTCISAERAMNKKLGGSCCAPIAAYAAITRGQVTLQGFVGSLDGSQIIRCSAMGNNAEQVGLTVAKDLLNQGAAKLLSLLHSSQIKPLP